MNSKYFTLRIIVILVIFQETTEFRFLRRIEAVGCPYYKISMTLGVCKKSLIYTNQKIWGKNPLNRVLDIYYRSDTPGCPVSRVEIMLIMNSTNTIAFSEAGVGNDEFYATLYLPLNIGFILYKLDIYTCTIIEKENPDEFNEVDYLPFLHKI